MKTYLPTRVNGKPPNPYPYLRPPWRIALIANSKENFRHRPGDPPDAGAEFDKRETIQGIARALESDGHWVHLCEADYTLPEAIGNLRPHICFNIAEGLSGDGREAQTPAVLELMGIPYTASRVVANAISLDKTRTKRIWQQMGLPTAAFREFQSIEELTHADLSDLRFPLFIKPTREGTGMGVSTESVVHDRKSLEEQAAWIIETYNQPVLVEEFLPGREFTVGFIGNPGKPTHRKRPELYDAEGFHWLPVMEIDTAGSVSPGVYGHDAKDLAVEDTGAPAYLCPADISESLRLQLIELAGKAAQALGTCDVGRVDFRLDANGEPHLLEINTLPGLNPSVSDLCLMAAAEELPYEVLITEILYLAAERFGLSLAITGRPADALASTWKRSNGRSAETAVPILNPPILEALR